ncbi:hypothetical protein ACFWJT_13715 [Streptomyces sp. NPDC127069]|uniref:hypothetical protein n=1 Tax=Streptomyces sp. NPDC127069 TaxID=3347128 RepID=UPI0036578D29
MYDAQRHPEPVGLGEGELQHLVARVREVQAEDDVTTRSRLAVTDQDDRTPGTGDHRQRHRTDDEPGDPAQPARAEHQQLGLLRRLAQHRGRPAAPLPDEHLQARMGAPHPLGRRTRDLLAHPGAGPGADEG